MQASALVAAQQQAHSPAQFSVARTCNLLLLLARGRSSAAAAPGLLLAGPSLPASLLGTLAVAALALGAASRCSIGCSIGAACCCCCSCCCCCREGAGATDCFLVAALAGAGAAASLLLAAAAVLGTAAAGAGAACRGCSCSCCGGGNCCCTASDCPKSITVTAGWAGGATTAAGSLLCIA